MSAIALSNRSLAAMGCVGALAAVGGAVYFKTARRLVIAAGLIIALVAIVFSACKHYFRRVTNRPHENPQKVKLQRHTKALTPAPAQGERTNGSSVSSFDQRSVAVAAHRSQSVPSALQSIVERQPGAANSAFDALALVPARNLVSPLGNTQDLVESVLKFLPVEDVVSAECVSKQWKSWARDNVVWQELCDREGIPPIRRAATDRRTRQAIELLFYKAAYQHLFPIIFGPKQYSDCLRIKAHGERVRLKDDIHDMLDPTHQKKFRLIYLSRQVERPNPNGTTSIAQMTIKLLGELMQAPGVRHPTKYDFISLTVSTQHGDATLNRSDWGLFSAKVVEGTRNASYAAQVSTVAALGARAPKLIEATALNFFNHARFGTCLFGRDPWTYSRTETSVTYDDVQYHTVVVGFGPLGLGICSYGFDDDGVGMAAAFSCGSSAGIGTCTKAAIRHDQNDSIVVRA